MTIQDEPKDKLVVIDEYPRSSQKSDRSIRLRAILLGWATVVYNCLFRDLRHLFARQPNAASTRTQVRDVIAVSIATVLIIVNMASGIHQKLTSLSIPFDNAPFNRTVWRAVQSQSQKEERAQMAGGLARYLTGDMTEKQVLSLLGQPDWQTDDPYHEGTRAPRIPTVKHMLQYKMGSPWMDLTGESYLLQLYFDKKDRYLMCAIEID